jgi:hypothetical protein
MFRKGQWVRVPSDQVAKAFREATHQRQKSAIGIVTVIGGTSRKADGTVVEHVTVPVREGAGHVRQIAIPEGSYLVDLVDGNGNTLGTQLLVGSALAAVVSRDDIPAKRLATMQKNWTPKP